MSRKTRERRPGPARPPRTQGKSLLLPMAQSLAMQVSIDNHLTLEVLRRGAAESFHLASLRQATYFAMLLNAAGYGDARPGLFRETDDAITRCQASSEQTGIWRIDDDAFDLLCEVLTLHDRQLATVPMYGLMDATRKLQKAAQK